MTTQAAPRPGPQWGPRSYGAVPQASGLISVLHEGSRHERWSHKPSPLRGGFLWNVRRTSSYPVLSCRWCWKGVAVVRRDPANLAELHLKQRSQLWKENPLYPEKHSPYAVSHARLGSKVHSSQKIKSTLIRNLPIYTLAECTGDSLCMLDKWLCEQFVFFFFFFFRVETVFVYPLFSVLHSFSPKFNQKNKLN